MPILRFLLFNIRPRKDMKAIFDKVQFFTITFLNISEKPTKIFWFLEQRLATLTAELKLIITSLSQLDIF